MLVTVKGDKLIIRVNLSLTSSSRFEIKYTPLNWSFNNKSTVEKHFSLNRICPDQGVRINRAHQTQPYTYQARCRNLSVFYRWYRNHRFQIHNRKMVPGLNWSRVMKKVLSKWELISMTAPCCPIGKCMRYRFTSRVEFNGVFFKPTFF